MGNISVTDLFKIYFTKKSAALKPYHFESFSIYASFQYRKMAITRKQLSESEVAERLRTGQLALPPLRLDLQESEVPSKTGSRPDFLIQASWQGEQVRFAAEWKAQSTPKAFDEALRKIQTSSLPPDCLPLMVLPYLRESQLAQLEQSGISGIDLCGNGVVIAQGRFFVLRTGARNQFPTYSPIKNVYRKNTSMVARLLLSTPYFKGVSDLCAEVNERNLLVSKWGRTPMRLGTVSKALKALSEDLIVDRVQGVRLLQADKLLDQLQENYKPPDPGNRVSLKVEGGQTSLTKLLRKSADLVGLPIVATGLSSVSRYATMQRGYVLSLYCPRISPLLEQLPGTETNLFPNVELVETGEEPVYFDAEVEDNFPWASPVQTYLELMKGDKRDQETAEQVRSLLLGRAGEGER